VAPELQSLVSNEKGVQHGLTLTSGENNGQESLILSNPVMLFSCKSIISCVPEGTVLHVPYDN
jgi:hypothetical protein